MSITFEVTMSIRYLRAKNASFCSIMTLFSIIGLALGVATLIVVMSVMNGFREKLLNSILGIDGHIIVSFNKDVSSDYYVILKSIEKIPGVLKTIPMTLDQVIVAANGKVTGSVVRGVSVTDLLNKSTIISNIIAGNVEKFNEGVIIGARLAETLNVNCGNKVAFISSKEFNVSSNDIPRIKEYKVVAVFDTGIFEYDNALIYMPIELAQAFFDYGGDNIKNIEVFVDNLIKADELASSIEKKVGMEVVSWQLQQSHYFSALKAEKNVMFLILTLIIVVAAFNIVSNLMIIAEEKKSTIAVMRTFGATTWSVIRIFCICGLIIGFIGTCLGCIIGVVFSLNVENIRIFLEGIVDIKLFNPIIYFFSSLPVVLIPQDVINISVLSLFLSFIATIVPALQAATRNPAEILRYE